MNDRGALSVRKETLLRRIPAYLLVFALALAVRVVFVAVSGERINWESTGYGSELGQIAKNVAEGRGFSSPFSDGDAPTAWLSPLVPALWALVFHFCGAYTRASLLCLLGLNCVLSAVSCVVYAHLSMHIWRRRYGGGTRVFLLAGMIFALWPSSLEMVGLLWYFCWQEVACALLFWAAVVWVDRMSLGVSLSFGLAAGVTALINPVPLVLPVAIVLWVLFRRRRRRLHVFKCAALAAGVGLLLAAPWAIRNYSRLGVFVPFRSSLWVEVMQGNNPRQGIKQTRNSVHPALHGQEREVYQRLGETAYIQSVKQRTLSFIRNHPLLTLKRTALRIYVYWCTDLADWWPWQPRPPWWRGSESVVLIRVVRIASRLVPLGSLLLLLLVSGALRWLPFKPCFVTVFLLFPLPYYFTHVRYTYSYQVQPYVMLCALLGWLSLHFGHSRMASSSRTRSRSL